jgi:hypothetical protein
MRDLTEENLTEAVLARYENCKSLRFQEIMRSLVRHLHAFIREVEGWDDVRIGVESNGHAVLKFTSCPQLRLHAQIGGEALRVRFERVAAG